jgi:hypothetical protein
VVAVKRFEVIFYGFSYLFLGKSGIVILLFMRENGII